MITKPETNSKLARAYEILDSMYGGSNLSDDSPRTPMLIMQLIDSVYPAVLKDYLKELEYEGKNIDPSLLTSYTLTLSASDEEMEAGCKNFLVKKASLPSTIQFKGKPAISYAGGIDKDYGFFWGTSSYEALSRASGGRFVEARPSYWVEGNTLYTVLPKGFSVMEEMKVVMVPEDPSATTTGACFDIFSSKYPIAGHLWFKVKNQILTMDNQIMNQGVQLRDPVNDGVAA